MLICWSCDKNQRVPLIIPRANTTRAPTIAETPARCFMLAEMLTDVWVTQQITTARGAYFASALSFSRYLIYVTPMACSKAHSHHRNWNEQNWTTYQFSSVPCQRWEQALRDADRRGGWTLILGSEAYQPEDLSIYWEMQILPTPGEFRTFIGVILLPLLLLTFYGYSGFYPGLPGWASTRKVKPGR